MIKCNLIVNKINNYNAGNFLISPEENDLIFLQINPNEKKKLQP